MMMMIVVIMITLLCVYSYLSQSIEQGINHSIENQIFMFNLNGLNARRVKNGLFQNPKSKSIYVFIIPVPLPAVHSVQLRRSYKLILFQFINHHHHRLSFQVQLLRRKR